MPKYQVLSRFVSPRLAPAVLVFALGCSNSLEPSRPLPVASSTPATPVGPDGMGLPGTGGTSGSLTVVPTPGEVPGPLAPTALRRMTNAEYRNTVRYLLSLPVVPIDSLEPETRSGGFDNPSDVLVVSSIIGSQYASTAQRLVKDESARILALAACPSVGDATAELKCARDFVTSFGLRAFRRPLSAEEASAYEALFVGERAQSDYAGGISQVVESLLQSPKFLYRFELGVPDPTQRTLTPFEVASQLSYLFTASMPDSELLLAAQNGQLATPSEIEAQARRLLALPATRPALAHFMSQYAGVDTLAQLTKDTETYPAYTLDLLTAFGSETEKFVDSILWDGDGTFRSLMTAPYSFVDTTLAGFYGVPDPGQGPTLVKQALNPGERTGLLTQASVLAMHSKRDESFPIARGEFIRTQILCQTLTPPPPSLNVTAVPKDPNLTTRERFAVHTASPACAGCHALIDPVGFGFENYDGIGQYRTVENGKPIDSSGILTATADIDGPFVGAIELAQKLAGSAEAQRCVAQKANQFAFGRAPTPQERTELAQVVSTLGQGGLDIRELLVALSKSSTFYTRSLF